MFYQYDMYLKEFLILEHRYAYLHFFPILKQKNYITILWHNVR